MLDQRLRMALTTCISTRHRQAFFPCRDACYVTAWSVGEDGMMAMSAHVKAATAAAPCMDVTADGSKIAVATAEGDVVVSNQPCIM